MQTTYSEFWNDYDLIDAGNDKKLERWGDIITIRPDRNAYFPSVMNHKEWEKLAHLEFVETGKKSGEWVSLKKDAPKEWSIKYQLPLGFSSGNSPQPGNVLSRRERPGELQKQCDMNLHSISMV